MKLWGKPALLLAVTMIVAGCSAPPPVDPNIQAKADAFSAQVKSDMAAEAAAAAEAKLVRLSFPKDRPLKVFYAGDSLNAGFFSSVQANAYRPLVTAELSKSGPVEEVRATKPASAPLFQIVNIDPVPASGVDLAIMELGTNDVKRTDIPTFRQTYDDVLTKLQAGSPAVKIICAGAWGYGGPEGTDPYDKEIQAVCEKHGGRYVDLTDTFMTPGTYGPAGLDSWAGKTDNFHPNDKGHRAIADLLLERIRLS